MILVCRTTLAKPASLTGGLSPIYAELARVQVRRALRTAVLFSTAKKEYCRSIPGGTNEGMLKDAMGGSGVDWADDRQPPHNNTPPARRS
jgi:hypothetical protein